MSDENLTLDEIKQQFKAWGNVLETSSEGGNDIFDFMPKLDDAEVFFIGCGTSFYLSQAAATVYTALTGCAARAVTSSDVFLYADSLFPKNRKISISSSV